MDRRHKIGKSIKICVFISLLCTALFIFIYLYLSTLDLAVLMASQKPAVPIFGLYISMFLFPTFIFYFPDAIGIIKYLASIIFSFFLFLTISRMLLCLFIMVQPSVRSIVPIFDDIGQGILLYAGVIFVTSLLAYLVYILRKTKESRVLYNKALAYAKQGDYEKAIKLGRKGLSTLNAMEGFFLKIDPFFKALLLDCYLQLSRWCYLMGDYDNAIKNIRKVKEFDNKKVYSVYRGEADISGFTKEVIKPRAFDNNIFKKYLKIKGFIKKPAILQKLKFEHGLVAGLIVAFAFYAFTLLTSDYTYITTAPKINQIFTWLVFSSLFIFSLILLLVTSLKVEKGYSENIFDFFNLSQAVDLLAKEKELKSMYKLLSLSLLLICLLYAIQSTTWFVREMPFLSAIIGISIIVFIYTVLILSVVGDYINATFSLVKEALYGNFFFIGAISCLPFFTGVFTIFLTFLEGYTYDFQQVLPPFFTATFCFIFTLNFVYQEFNAGSNKLIGDTYYSEGKYEEACERYKKIERHGNNRFYKTVFPPSDTLLSNLYMAYGDSKFRLGEKQKALTLLNKSLEFAEVGNLTSYLWQIHYKIGQIKEDEGKLEEAYESYKRSIDKIEGVRGLVKIAEGREAFFENKAEVYVKMVFLCLRLGRDEEAFNYAERAKGRVFLELLGTAKVEVKAKRPELKEEEEELLRKIRTIEVELTEGRGVREEKRRELDDALKEYDNFLFKIKEEDPEFSSLKKVDALTVNKLQGLLKENEAILEFFVGERPVAFILQRDSFNVVEIPLDKEELEVKVDALRLRIMGGHGGVKRVSEDIYNYLIKPLEPMLNGKELITVPHSILHYLPFNALYDGKNWFIEKYKARFLQNASMLQFLKGRKKAKIKNAFIVGNPTKDLINAEMEAIKIADKFHVEPLLRDEAKKETVIERCKGKDILHFACHGMFEAGFPKFSRLMLADDNLLVTQIYNLDLDAADLVTLSACQTGLGGLTNGDEVEGLTRAFMRAGTPSVIASLWSVSDESTAELFLRFYEGAGDKVERLRNAQIETMKEYKHPFYWAGFVLFGER